MMRICAIMGATVALSASACAAGGEQEGIVLSDPITGEAVGYIDEVTGDYHLDALDESIPPDAIERTWVEPSSELAAAHDGNAETPGYDTQKSLCESVPGQTVCMEPDGSSCWIMSHCDATQCVQCEGCCKKTGTNRWYCWEKCTDVMSTSSPKGTAVQGLSGDKGGYQDGSDIVLRVQGK